MMRPTSKRKATDFPVRWQPHAELTAAAWGGEGSIVDTSLLGGGRRDGIVEKNLISQFKGEANQQVTKDRAGAEPWFALSLSVGSEEEPQPQPQPQNRLRSALTRHLPARSSVPPQTYAPGSSPAGAGLAPAPAPQLGSNSVGLPPGVRATPPEPRCGACTLCYDGLKAELLKRVSEELDRRVGLLRQELSAEVTKEVLRILTAAAAVAGVPLPGAFSAGLPQPQPVNRCPACGASPGTVALKPHEHLCLCAQCWDASRVCRHCYGNDFTWTAAVETASRGRGRGGALPWRPRPSP